MPTFRQSVESTDVQYGIDVPLSVMHTNLQQPLVLVEPCTSAIEYIVATARPGEVIHVTDAEYYNPHLWRSYED